MFKCIANCRLPTTWSIRFCGWVAGAPASWWLGWWRQKALSEHVAKKRMRGERTKYACDTQTRSSVRTRSYVLSSTCSLCYMYVLHVVVFILRYSTTCTTACARVAMSRSHSRSLAARLAIHSHIRFESSIESRRDSNACDKKRGNKYAASAKGRVYHAQCNGATAVAFHCRSHRWYK